MRPQLSAGEAKRYIWRTIERYTEAGLTRDQAIDRIAREHRIARFKIALVAEL